MELRTKMHVLTLRFIMICGRKQSLIPEQKGKKKGKKETGRRLSRTVVLVRNF